MKVTTDERKAPTLLVVNHGRAVPVDRIQKSS
jgi:hypothetical protein